MQRNLFRKTYFASINKGEVDISRALETVGLNPQDKRKYRKYSLGMKQRLGIACAIMEEPKLLLLSILKGHHIYRK